MRCIRKTTGIKLVDKVTKGSLGNYDKSIVESYKVKIRQFD